MGLIEKSQEKFNNSIENPKKESDDYAQFNESIKNAEKLSEDANKCHEKATVFLESALKSLESYKLQIKKHNDILHTRHDQLNSVLRTFKEVFPSEESKKLFHTRFAAVSMSSTVLTSTIPEYAELNKLCGFPIDQKWMLLYRGSVDGFGADDFHNICDGKANTLTIVKSDSGNVFGGYTNVAWDSQGGYRNGIGSFLFSFKNQTNNRLKFNCAASECCNSIYCRGSYGPEFGVNDLHISNNSNANTESSSYLGNSYEIPPGYTNNTVEAKNLLAGSYQFKVNEIEVFAKA